VANGFTMPNYRSMGFLVLLFHADILLVSYPPYAWVLEFLKLLPFTRKIMGCKVPSNRITKVVRGFYVPGGGRGGCQSFRVPILKHRDLDGVQQNHKEVANTYWVVCLIIVLHVITSK